MKIGILVSGLPPFQVGGAEKQALMLANRLARRHPVTILTRKKQHHYKELKAEPGLTVVALPHLKGHGLNYLSFVFSSLVAIRRRKIDILLSYGFGPHTFAGALSRLFFRIPFLFSIRGKGSTYYQKSRWIGCIHRVILKNTDLVIVQSRSMVKVFKNSLARLKLPTDFINVEIIPNGVERTSLQAGGDRVLYVGSLVRNDFPDKGVRYLIEALRGTSLPALIVGDGPERPELECLAEGFNVEFRGKISPDRVLETMLEGRILVLPSRSEGFPNVLLEAMSVGLPIVATNVGGVPDLIENEKTGLLVEAGDPALLRAAILRLYHDEKLRDTVRLNASNRINDNSWEKVIEVTISILEGLFRESKNRKM